jgi:nitroreductase
MVPGPRAAENPVDPLILERWSPRAFDGTAMRQADLDTLFEAARWAPSAFNYQPWRFLYAHRHAPEWPMFLSLLLPFNAAWAQHASVLVFILSDRMMGNAAGDLQPLRSHSFDAGAGWALLALQATRLGYHAHGMTGIDFHQAREELRVPERFAIEAAAAIGRRGDTSVLPESLRAREAPSGRLPIERTAFQGRFPAE